MSKYNDYLTEIVYQIDDIIYDFYRKSNEVIAGKRNTEDLLNFRDETITTVNEMNVRALEIIASFKKDELVEDRAAILIQRNQDILDSAYDVLDRSPNKGEFFYEMKEAAKDALHFTGEKVAEFQDSDTYHNIKDVADKGYVRLKDAVNAISEDKRVQEGVQFAKDVSKEALHKSEELYYKGEAKLKKWWDETRSKTEEFEEEFEEKFEDVQENFTQEYEELKESVKEDYNDEYESKKEEFQELKDKIESKASDAKDKLDREIEELQEELKQLGITDEGKTE